MQSLHRVEKSHAPNDRKADPRPPSFRRKRCGVEKSHSSIVQEAWRQEISGPRAPLEPRIPARAPLQMTMGSPLLSWDQNKGIKKEALFRELLLCL